MQTTFWFYVVFALIFILPLVLFNIKKFRKKDKHGKYYPNIVRIVVVSVLTVLIVLFSVGTYNFTIKYQPMIVAERYFTEFGRLVTGRISQEEFKQNTSGYVEYGEGLEEDIDQLLEDSVNTGSTLRFQIGNEITAKYYTDTNDELFQPVSNGSDDNPLYIGIHAELDGESADYLMLVRKVDTTSMIENIYKIDAEGMEYLKSKNLMRGDLVSKWFEVN